MKRLITLFTLAGALAASNCFAIPVTVQRLPGYFAGHGGEFNVKAVIGNGYALDVLVGGGFETFCSSRSTSINVPATYFTGALVPEANNAVSFLFNQFATGALAGYNYTPGVNREASALALQLAIWNLLGQIPDADLIGNAQALSDKSAGLAAPVGTYNVFVLPLSKANGTGVQPMLVFDGNSVPDGGLTAMLLGMGLIVTTWFSRRCNV
jgi:hypothetical protein